MARFPLALPRGILNNGTRYQSKGRWHDSWGVRWYGNGLGPIKGSRVRGVSSVSGKARAAIAWKSNNFSTWLGVGTHTKLYVMDRASVLYDITPSGFTGGNADAIAGGGYGTGLYGAGTYGTPRPDNTLVIDATMWTLDTWGEDLLGVSPDDRKLYEWVVASGTGTIAAAVVNAPTGYAVVVTPERFVFMLGTDDPRTVSWCDQENNTVWTPSSTNQAGSFPLTTSGRLMCGARLKDLTLLLTDVDAHVAQYIGGTLVYSFNRVGTGCGAISRGCIGTFGTGEAVWMSPGLNFWTWNGGSVAPLECDVLDYIRQDINTLQISKIIAVPNAANFEIEFRYCSEGSTEIDKAVVWHWKDAYWTIGREPRTCGVDGGVFQYPILLNSSGAIYDHEVTYAYVQDSPFVTGGPVELGNGDNIMHVMGIYPDDDMVGDVNISFTVRRNADDTGTDYGPYTLTQKTDVRFSGGQVEPTITGVNLTDWRVGVPKLELMQGEARG